MVSTRRRNSRRCSSIGRSNNRKETIELRAPETQSLPVINPTRLHYAQLRNAQLVELLNDLAAIGGLEMHGHDVHAVVSQLLQFFTKRSRREVTRHFRELRHSIRKRRFDQQGIELLHFIDEFPKLFCLRRIR